MRKTESVSQIEIRDLDELMTKEEVLEAIPGQGMKVISLRKMFGGAQSAVAVLPTRAARSLCVTGHLKVDLIYARVSHIELPARCYSCLFFGHFRGISRGGPKHVLLAVRRGWPFCPHLHAMIKFSQANLGGSSGAQNLVLQTAAERGTDILILSEFYKFGKNHEHWHYDRSCRTAIAPMSNLSIDDIGGESDGFV